MIRLRLVEHGQDHRIDADRFAGTGRPGDQQMRRLGQVGDHRLAADVLAEANGERAGHVVIWLAGDDLGQLDRLPLGIRQFERHARLAGHRLDDTDRHHGQGTGQVTRQIDDLRALDAHCRLDFVAGNHRPRHGSQNLDLYAEVGELALDQARGVFQRLGADRLGDRRRRVEQVQRRQLPADDGFGEERDLLLALDALLGFFGNRHFGRRRLDDDRVVEFDTALFHLHFFLALLRDFTPDAPVAPAIHETIEEAANGFEEGTQPLESPEPGHPGKNAPTCCHRRQ